MLALISGCKTTSTVSNPVVPVTTGIAGNVTSFITGNQISQATITTTPATNSVTTDIYGDYILDNIAPGSYKVTAYKTTFDSSTISVTVIADKTTRADIAIKPTTPVSPGRLRGVVINAATDSVISDANVYTVTKPYYTTKTNASGVYDMTGISPGFYDLAVEKFGFTTKTIKITVVSDSIQIIDFSLQPIYGRITGKVTDSTNTGIEGVNISSTPPSGSVLTDFSGHYTIENLAKGIYKITTSKTGYVAGSVSVSVLEGRTSMGDFVLTKSATGK